MYERFINLETPTGATPGNAFDIFKGQWNYRIPREGVASGSWETFFIEPPCVRLLKEFFPDCKDFDVLELGPHESENTYHLHKLVRSIDSVEGRPANFLKCLLVKNEFAVNNVKFVLGDFVSYLEHSDKRWDLCYCAGVLYHLPDPIRLLDLISRKCKRLVLGTVVYDREGLRKADEEKSTGWLRDIKPEPVLLEFRGKQYPSWRRNFTSTDWHNMVGHGASHSSYASMLDANTLKDVLLSLNGTLLTFRSRPHPFGPMVDAVLEFPANT